VKGQVDGALKHVTPAIARTTRCLPHSNLKDTCLFGTSHDGVRFPVHLSMWISIHTLEGRERSVVPLARTGAMKLTMLVLGYRIGIALKQVCEFHVF
jgi:hypothetical protein